MTHGNSRPARGISNFFGMRLDVVVVNWNSGTYLSSCVRSLAECSHHLPGMRLVVVDNASTDGSCDGLPSDALPLTLIRNRTNRGFAAACNQGARTGSAPLVLFLNPDSLVPAPSLWRAVDFMAREAHEDIGILGIQLRDGLGRVTRRCARFPRPGMLWARMVGLDRMMPTVFKPHLMTDWDHLSSRYVDQVIGAFFLVRREVFDLLSGFDERFFLYFDDVDLSLRARRSGIKSYYFADAYATHFGSGSTANIKATRYFYSMRSRILYAAKHFGRLGLATTVLGTFFFEPISRILFFLSHGDAQSAAETVSGWIRLWRELPTFIRQPIRRN